MDEFSRRIAQDIERSWPGWRLIGRELEGAWYATIPDADPPVVAWGEHPDELVYEIARKNEIRKLRRHGR